MPKAATATETDNVTRPAQFAKDQLKTIIERIESREEDKKAVSDDIRDIYARLSLDSI